MSEQVRGVVAKGVKQPVSVETIVVPDPGPGEVKVRVQACGVCHTDLHYREGGIGADFPYLLGHEAAGEVEAVGAGVTSVAPGDFVVLNWRAVCGECRACRRGRPWYCFSTDNAQQEMTLADGTALSPALGIGAFAEKTVVAAGQATPVDARADAAAAGLLGCGVMAGFGAATYTGGIGRDDTVAVFGCGGVGDAAIAAARLAGARTIIGVDLDARKLEWALGFGATHTVDASKEDPVDAVRALTDGNGADVCIEAVGRPEVLKQAFYARDLAGTVVQVGVPTPDMALPDIPMIDFFGRGGALKPSWYGDCLPNRDFPTLIALYLQGRFPLDKFVSETIALDDVEEAFHKMERGEVLRSVVVLEIVGMAENREWGPLAALIGEWEGSEGVDFAYANERGATGETKFRETLSMKPFGPVENGKQVLYGLDYRTAAWRTEVEEENPFHTEVGYWLWDAADRQVMRCFMVPRGSVLIAGGTAEPADRTFTMAAECGSEVYGILSNPFLAEKARTALYSCTITVHDDGSWSYDETSTIEHAAHGDTIAHTDRNTLRKA